MTYACTFLWIIIHSTYCPAGEDTGFLTNISPQNDITNMIVKPKKKYFRYCGLPRVVVLWVLRIWQMTMKKPPDIMDKTILTKQHFWLFFKIPISIAFVYPWLIKNGIIHSKRLNIGMEKTKAVITHLIFIELNVKKEFGIPCTSISYVGVAGKKTMSIKFSAFAR